MKAITGLKLGIIITLKLALSLSSNLYAITNGKDLIKNFQATLQVNDLVKLSWEAYFENTTYFFELERSNTDLKFTSIFSDQLVSGSNFYLDHAPFLGFNYYRIKITNNDGEIEYSPIISIKTKNTNFTCFISPNPITQNNTFLAINVNGVEKKDTYNISIFNMKGEKVYDHFHQISPNEKVTLNSQRFTTGKYHLIVSSSNGVHIKHNLIML
jgi:hypothetical protein